MKNMLLSPFKKPFNLKNRVVMAPMTRSRAENGLPTEIMKTYYQQRAGAGLIITEGVAPSPNGQGYARIPGIYNDEQVAEWKKITDAVHSEGSKMVVQLMHSGRISHPLNLPQGAEVVAPSAIVAGGTIWTDQEGAVPHPTPKEMTLEDIEQAIEEFVNASRKSMEAGFDGVELHAANGYLLEQFLNPLANRREDQYGGSMENRSRMVLEVAQAVVEAIGKDKVGIRLSPYGVNGDLGAFDGLEAQYEYLTDQLNEMGIGYIHIADHSSMGAPQVPSSIKESLRKRFDGTLILSGGYDRERAEADLQAGKGDLVAFGRPFIANPDLVARWEANAPLNEPDFDTFYTGAEKGYIDYPIMEAFQS